MGDNIKVNPMYGINIWTGFAWLRTEPIGVAIETLQLRIEGFQVKILARRPAILAKIFCGFPQSFQENGGQYQKVGRDGFFLHHF
jgi:hypothetical protein